MKRESRGGRRIETILEGRTVRIRRMFQFNLKMLLIVTAVIGASLSYEMRRVARQAKAAHAIRRMCGSVGYDALPLAGDGELRIAGVVHLKPLLNLHSMALRGYQVTDAGKAKLKQVLPKCSL